MGVLSDLDHAQVGFVKPVFQVRVNGERGPFLFQRTRENLVVCMAVDLGLVGC